MNRKKHLFLQIPTILLILMLSLTFSIHGKAFGDSNDYDYGGSDWGDSDWGDSDWGSDSSYYYGDSDSDSEVTLGDMVIAIVIILVLIFFFTRKGNGKGGSTPPRGTGRVPSGRGSANGRVQHLDSNKVLPDRTDQVQNAIRIHDPNFTSYDFISYVKKVYVDIQDAWCRRDLTSVQSVLHPNLYEQTDRQLMKKKEDGIVPHLDRLSVNTAYPTTYHRDKDYEYVGVYLAAQMIDYQTRESTGEVVYGDTTTRWYLQYKMIFIRSNGMKTPDSTDKEEALICPNCGAPINSTSFGKCEYCGSVVTSGKYGWVLSQFGVVRNDTVDEGVQVPTE